MIPASNDAAWFTTAYRTGEAQVRWEDGRVLRCAAQVVYSPAELARIRSLFQAKYGEAVYRAYFDTVRRALLLDPHQAPRAPLPDELLRTEFESVALGYDAAVASHPIEQYLKERTASLLVRALRGFDPLLEIGPGTGYHTLPLLLQGHRVLAIDLSEAMIDRLRVRATEAMVNDRLEVRTGRLRDLERLTEDLPNGTVRGAYSAFGPFNLEPELEPAIRAFARLLPPGGRLEFTALNRPGLIPMMWEIVAGRPGAALYRLGEVIPPGRGRFPLELHVPALAGWDRLLRPSFRRVGIEPVSAVAPPFDSHRLATFLGHEGLRRARKFDERISRLPAAWVTGEWVLLAYERTGAPAARAPGP